MSVEVKVPMLPESVADATVLTWHKKIGEQVTEDETLVDLETDKVVLEVPAPTSGVLQAIEKEEGSNVVADELIALIEAGAVATKTSEQSKTAEKVNGEATTADVSVAAIDTDLTPAVRRLVAEHQLEVAKITGTGKDGRITKKDVMSFVESNSKVAPAPAQTNVAVVSTGSREEKRVPMSRLRARIAERLLEAQQTTAMLTTFNEVNLQAIMDIRKQYKEKFEKTHGARLGFMSFFTKAAIEALKRFPSVNASIDGTDIVYHNYYDIGIAVSTDRGLVVPILRDAEHMSLADIEKGIVDAATKAQQGKLTIEEMSGGTFTISNGGVFGSMLSTPILNPPQSAILGMHRIDQRPVVENGEIVIRPMMYLALSYDHRIIDGKESVSFLVAIKELLEDPSRLLLEI